MSQLQFAITTLSNEWVEIAFPNKKTYDIIHSLLEQEGLKHVCNLEKLTLSTESFPLMDNLLKNHAIDVIAEGFLSPDPK